MYQKLYLLLFISVLFTSCTVGRWTVADDKAIDTSEPPAVINQQTVFQVEQHPTVENPVIVFSPYAVSAKEYTQRIKVERSIQKYRPRGVFLTTSLAGAAFAFLAANSDAVMPSASVSQRTILNLTGTVLSALTLLNLEPTGEPIETGESRLMRKSGTELVQDTTKTTLQEGASAGIVVRFQGNVIFDRSAVDLTQNKLELNVGAFANDLSDLIEESSEIEIELTYEGAKSITTVPVQDFLRKYVRINIPIAFLRTSREINDRNIAAEVGEGSQLEFMNRTSENWYLVRYNDMDVYLQQNAGELEWISPSGTGSALLVEYAEVPFGEIDVERSIPVLKNQNPRDRGLVITNGINNQIGIRQYLDRDHRLFRFYLHNALQLRNEHIQIFENQQPEDWAVAMGTLPDMYDEGTLYVYLSGFATIRNEEVVFTGLDDEGEIHYTPLNTLFESLKDSRPQRLFIFADLEYRSGPNQSAGTNGNEDRITLDRSADVILSELPNSAIIFSNLPGQSSSLFTGTADENKRHHIFNYFWAEALQQQKTGISDLILHLQNNVDYTSRRLHDRPQEIRAYGNMSLNLTE